MKNIKVALWLLLLVVSAFWLLADTLVPQPFTYFSFRHVFVQYSGVLGMAMMSVAMLLAVRPRLLERPLDGLDKMYRLHKWLGIGGLVVATLHWWWAQGTKWMVGWGWLSRPERGSGGSGGALRTPLEQWLREQRGLAESLGEWAFYAAAVLIILALIKAFPYRLFQKTHKWLALAYLVLVYHALVLLEFAYWSQPIGWFMALLMLGGTLAALWVLAGRVGRGVPGVITELTTYPALRVIEGTLRLENGWRGHKPGQFAFVTSRHEEGAHPYTIASAWNPDERCLTFIVKELGDWTGRLSEVLRVGMPVRVAGPHGCFDFDDQRPRQIWIGAGIGITPFIARMQHLARVPGQQSIDLFHPTAEYDEVAIDKLRALAEAANVRLHVIVSPRDGRLTPEQIREAVPDWRSASLWFCGPAAFGESLRKDFVKHGLPARRFHQELFAMR